LPDTQNQVILINIMANTPKTHKEGRDARNGQFTTVREAKEHPKTHVVERVPNPGRGDTKK